MMMSRHLTGFNRKSSLLFLLGFILLGHASDMWGEDILTVYRQAVASSPVVARARASLQADEAFNSVNRSAFFPRIQADAGISRNDAEIRGFGSPIDESYYANNYSVTLTQPIFRGRDWVALRASEAQVRAGEKALLAAEQSLMLQVSVAYFQVLSARANERIALSKKDLLKKTLEQAEAFLKEGVGDITTVKEAKARLDAAESDLIGARNAVRVANQTLKRLTHGPVGVLRDVRPFEPHGPVPDRVEPWVQAAMKNQPLLLEAREQLQISGNQIEIARRARWPRLDLETGYSYSKGSLLPSEEARVAEIGLAFVLPIFQGGEIRARTRQAEAQALAKQYRLENLEDQVRLDVETNFLRLKDSVAQLKATAQAVDSARISMEATRKGYEVGTRSFIDLFDSIQNLASARRNYYLALYNHVLSRVRLKAAAGLVSIQDIADINTLLGPGMNHPDKADRLPGETPER
jgi:outer membrane protein